MARKKIRITFTSGISMRRDIGQYGSIAIIERFIQTSKHECTRQLLVSFRREAIRRELPLFVA